MTTQKRTIEDLPHELLEKILSYLTTDPFTLHRVELVCQLWASVIHFFEERRGLNFRKRKVIKSKQLLQIFIEITITLRHNAIGN